MPDASDSSVQRQRMSFGAVVRARRTGLGLSQEGLAAKVSCDRQTIVRIETAVRLPSLDRIFVLADALGVSLTDLFKEFDRADERRRA